MEENKMKKVILSIVMMMALGVTAFAQDGKPTKEQTEEWLTKVFNIYLHTVTTKSKNSGTGNANFCTVKNCKICDEWVTKHTSIVYAKLDWHWHGHKVEGKLYYLNIDGDCYISFKENIDEEMIDRIKKAIARYVDLCTEEDVF